LKKIIIITILAIIVCSAIIHDYNNHLNSKVDVPSIDDIVSAQIYPSSVGAGFGVSMMDINLHDSMDRLAIAEILMWMKASKYRGKADNQMVYGGGSPVSLTLKLKNGDKIMIMDAITGVSIKVENAIAIKSTSIRDQVTLYINNKSMRINSPELKEWIEIGWKDFKKGDVENEYSSN
jgi:hypothetical protein